MRRLLALGATLAVLLLSPQGALAAWGPGSGGSGMSSGRSIGVPTSVTAASTGTSSIHVTWAAPGGGSVTPAQYLVSRTAPSAATVCTVGSGTFACDDTGLTTGTTYTYTVAARVGTNWSSGASATASATTDQPAFLVSVGSGSKTAGTAFTTTITATNDGVTTDTSYTGVKTVAFSGPAASPSGTNPTYPATVNFSAGVGTASVTLYAAASATLGVTSGIRSGSTAVTVVAGTATQLRYSSSTPDCSSGAVAVGNGGSFTSRVTEYDAYLNPKSQTGSSRSVTISRSPSQGSLNRTSLTIATGSSQSSQSFKYTHPTGNPPNTTVTAASSGLTSAACVVSRN